MSTSFIIFQTLFTLKCWNIYRLKYLIVVETIDFEANTCCCSKYLNQVFLVYMYKLIYATLMILIYKPYFSMQMGNKQMVSIDFTAKQILYFYWFPSILPNNQYFITLELYQYLENSWCLRRSLWSIKNQLRFFFKNKYYLYNNTELTLFSHKRFIWILCFVLASKKAIFNTLFDSQWKS